MAGLLKFMMNKRIFYINRHKSYLDNRIIEISRFINLEFSIGAIIEILISNAALPDDFPQNIFEAISELKNLIVDWKIEADGDVVGYIYQEFDQLAYKKSKGQYFTPASIVEYIIEKTIPADIDIENYTIIDPACGSGQFLIAAFKILIKLYQKKGIPFKDAASLIISNNLFGIDTDPIAVKIACFNLRKMTASFTEKQPNIYVANTLQLDEINFEHNPLLQRQYDLAVGNPPWGGSLTNKQKAYFRKHYYSSRSGINTFTLFIERSLILLKEDGRLGFLIPEAYLNIKAHRFSRQHVLENSIVKEIMLWGDQFKKVYAPSISIILEKTASELKRTQNIINISNTRDREQGIVQLIPQSYYHKTVENIFNINFNRKAVNIISKMDEQNCLYLNNNAKFFLGIVTGNNPRHLYNQYAATHPDKIVIGKDVSRYKINYSGHYFKYDTNALQQVAPEYLYKVKNKIVYKFIGKKLSFALDRKGYYTLNNVNAFIPELDNFSSESLVAVLNSSVVQYYYEKNFFTLKVLRGNLEKLPLKKLSSATHKKIDSLSRLAMESNSEHALKECKDNIDDILFQQYGLHDKDAYTVWRATNTTRDQAVLPGF